MVAHCWVAQLNLSWVFLLKTMAVPVTKVFEVVLTLQRMTKTLIHNLFMRWRDRFTFVQDAIEKAEKETGERKGHYMNVTAATPEEMYKRAEYAKELGTPIIMHDFFTAGFTANTGLANWCRDNGLLLHIHLSLIHI